MSDLYLKAPDEATMATALEALGVDGVYIDVIGLDPVRSIGIDADGNPITEVCTGYHVNVRTTFELSEEQVLAIEPFAIVAPNTPMRVWL